MTRDARQDAIDAATRKAEKMSRLHGGEFAILDRWAERGTFPVGRSSMFTDEQHRDVLKYVEIRREPSATPEPE
jgi:hypothetical protein